MVQQEIGIKTGLQKDFSWDSLGEAGVGSLVSSGVNATLPGANAAWTTASNQTTAFLQQAGKQEITALFTQVLDRALRLEKNIDWGQFIMALSDTLIVPNGKTDLSIANSQIALQMGQDVTDTLVDDGIEDLSQHQPWSNTLEAANALGTVIGDGLVYGGRDIYRNHRENIAANDNVSLDVLKDPFGRMITLPGDSLDLTLSDIYGPALQQTSQSNAIRNNNTPASTNSSNSMTQQTLSQAEQAANSPSDSGGIIQY